MKFTSSVLLTLLILILGELLSSNIILKREFDGMDKSDTYWNYEKVLEQPFRYLKITGGNGTRIAFEQNKTSSVRILQDWKRYHHGEFKALVKNDTLFLDFDYVPANMFEKFWLRGTTAIRVFSPQLLSIEGFNTNFEMEKMNQKSINVNISGRSKFELESVMSSFDSLTISQKDSSEVVFEMSPNYVYQFASDPGKIAVQMGQVEQIKSKETMNIASVKAKLEGYTLLDLGHAQIKSLDLSIADSSAIILSGGALKKALR